MRLQILVLALAALSSTAFAKWKPETPSEYLGQEWNQSLYFPFVKKLASLPNDHSGAPACEHFYSDIKAKRQMKIILGLGYYDDSEGQSFQFKFNDRKSGRTINRDFGMNATIDTAYMTMYAETFTRKCTGHLEVCGFKQLSPNLFTKTVRSPEGDSIAVTLEMHNGSYSPETPQNVGPLKAEQDAKSAATTNWFFSSLRTADLAIYNGHSRKGGGPDFNPPKLYKNLHVNYPWYASNTPGLKRLLEGLHEPTQPKALMMMSCNSTKLFSKKIAAVAPETAFTGTDEVIPGDITTKGALAGIDSVMRFQCEEGFNSELSATPEIQQHLTRLSFK